MSAHDAGRELDALIAEKVMGWKRGLRYGNGNGEWIEPSREDAPHKRTWDQTPRYSTDISAAWTVLERLAAVGMFVHLARFTTGEWRAEFRTGGFEASADTAPLTICRAALQAVAA